MFGVKAHQSGLDAQKVAEPLGCRRTHVVGRHVLTPDAGAHGRLDLVYRQMQGQHAGRAQHDVVGAHLRLHQRHARQLALR